MITALVVAVLAIAGVGIGAALASHSAGSIEIDLTIADNEVVWSGNNAVFAQGPLDINSAGTGVIDPFQTTQGGGNQDISKGYNTTDASAEFDTLTGGDRNHPILLSAIPEVTYPGDGMTYREFKLDINKSQGQNEFMAISELKLFLTDVPNITGYNDTATFNAAGEGTLAWDMGDHVVLMDYSLESGSGASDVTLLVKSSVFSTIEDCSYGSTECTTYLVLWSEYGAYFNTDATPLYPNRTWENNDGFEEWGVVNRPVVDSEKTADGTFDRTIEWEITKDVDPAQHDLFAGESDDSTYTITVDKTVTDGNFVVSGTITILNPTGSDDSPIDQEISAEIASIVDVIDQGGVETAATVTCPVSFPHTLAGGETLVCTYTVVAPNGDSGTNTATITVNVPEQIGGGTDTYTATDDFDFTPNTIGEEEVYVDDTNDDGDAGPFVDDAQYTYDATFTCSSDQADYTDGHYSENFPNTADLENGNGDVIDSDSEDVLLNCYAPIVTKDAVGGVFTQEFQWEIIKSVDPGSHTGFAGDGFSSEYTIEVIRSDVPLETNADAGGTITVENPHPSRSLTVDVSDEVEQGLTTVAATVDCGAGSTSLTVAAASSDTCDWDASLPNSGDWTNTATATLTDPATGASFTGSQDFNVALVVLNAEVSVDDTNDEGDAGPFVDSDQYNYDLDFVCPADSGQYDENGFFSFEHPNTADLVSDGQIIDSDDANVTVNCYIPLISKTADGTYDERHEWDIEKTVDPESQDAFAGETVYFDWTVIVTETVFEENFDVSGTITVENPNPEDDMVVAIADVLSDGTNATITGCAGGNLVGNTLTVPAGGTAVCDYEANDLPYDDDANAPDNNTATVSLNDNDYSADDPIEWTPTVIRGDADVTDDREPLNVHIEDDFQTTYEDMATCSSDSSVYGEDGFYTFDVSNTAIVSSGGIERDQSTATTTVNCYIPQVEKSVNTEWTKKFEWKIDKFVDDDSHTGFPGDDFDSNYGIKVTPTVTDGPFVVSGTIVITNPNPSAAANLSSVVDSISGFGLANVDCPSLVVPAGGSLECTYSADDVGNNSDRVNIATATFNGIELSDTKDVIFGDPIIVGFPEINVDDTYDAGDFGPVSVETTHAYSRNFVCPVDEGAYTDGVFMQNFPNTATIVETGQSDSEDVTLTCYLPANAKVTKTTDAGPDDIGQLPFVFELYNPGGELVETVFLGSEDGGMVVFNTEFTDDDVGTWTIVEVVPDGWEPVGPTECTFDVAFPAAAGQTFECSFHNVEQGLVTIFKTTNGQVDPTRDLYFDLYSGETLLETQGTLNDGDGVLPFVTLLVPGDTYTICERPINAGHTFEIRDGANEIVDTYPGPPGDDFPTGEVQCFDFVAEVGTNLQFDVENSFPGGGARTPGYWKNWNTCSGGNQAQTAAKLGGPDEGVYLLDDLLPQTIGLLTLEDGDCNEAVHILENESLDGKKRSNDAAYNLARALLAAELNTDAGACVPIGTFPVAGYGDLTWSQVLQVAQQELVDMEFNGYDGYAAPKDKNPDRDDLLALAGLIDAYNNGELCDGTPSH